MTACPVRGAMRKLSTRAGLADPHPIFSELREAGPIHEAPHFGPVVTRHADVHGVLFNRGLKVSSKAAKPGTARADLAKNMPDDLRALPPPLFLQDDPSHARLRKLLTDALSWRAVQRLAPFIETIANDLLDQISHQTRFDLIAHYAAPLPMQVIAHILGVEANDEFRVWSEDLVHELHSLAGPLERERATHGRRELVKFFRQQVHERRRIRSDDLIGLLVRACDDEGALCEDEVVSLCINLLVAGHITTSDLIGIMTNLLLIYPQERAKLEHDAALWPQAVDEALRFEPPTPMLARVHACPAVLHGRQFETGDSINVFMAPANRDPRRFENPDRFDVSREDNPHLSFGGGAHFCVGASLARLETQIAVKSLFARRQGLKLTEVTPVWRTTPNFRGFSTLVVDGADVSRVRGVQHLEDA